MTQDLPTEAQPSRFRWRKPPPPLEEQLVRSQFVVRGVVISDSEEGATLEVDAVLLKQSAADPSRNLAIVHGNDTVEGRTGIWVLGPGDPHEVLVGPSDAPESQVRRIFAGLPRLPDPPTTEEIRALAQQSDRIVFARLTASIPGSAEAQADETLKGEGPDTFEVAAAPDHDWEFPTGAPSYGVLFLEDAGNQWTVLNEQEPWRYVFTVVKAAIE